jgi:Mor family transcriptional regulator
MSKMSLRNREIFSALQAGKSLEDIAHLYGLTATRIKAILREEKLKRRYSLEAAYRDLRTGSPSGKS